MSALREDPLEPEAGAEAPREKRILQPHEVTDDTPPDALVQRGKHVVPLGANWKKGMPSPNPRGRPKSKSLAAHVRALVGDDPRGVARVFYDIAMDPDARNTDRIAAANALLDRGWGKAPAYAPIEGGDPLDQDDLDRAIRDIADELILRRAHPTLEPEVERPELSQ